jgi:hypothetical protein
VQLLLLFVGGAESSMGLNRSDQAEVIKQTCCLGAVVLQGIEKWGDLAERSGHYPRVPLTPRLLTDSLLHVCCRMSLDISNGRNVVREVVLASNSVTLTTPVDS